MNWFLRNHVHELNASEDGLRRSKRFGTQHRLGDAFDRAMILLDDVLLRYLTCRMVRGVSRSVLSISSSAAWLASLLSIVTLTGISVYRMPFSKKRWIARRIPLGRQQEVDRLAFLVDGPIQIFPYAFDLDVGLVHPPAMTDHMLVMAEGLFQQRQKPDGPTIDRRR